MHTQCELTKLKGKNSVGDLGVEGWNRSIVVCFNVRDVISVRI